MNREQQARESIAVFDRSDWDGVRALVAPDVVYEETGSGRVIEGVETVIAALQAWKEALPDATGEVKRVLVDGDTTVLEIVWRGTHTGPLATPTGPLPASGGTIETWATMWQRWDGDRIVHESHHLDMLAMLAQMGALPAPATA